MKVLFIGFSLFFTLNVLAIEVDQQLEDQWWREIKYSVDQATMLFDTQDIDQRRVVPNGHCYLYPQYFLACLRAVESLGQFLHKSQKFIATKETNSVPWIDAKILKDFGPLKLIEISSTNVSQLDKLKPQVNIARIKSEQDDLFAASAEMILANRMSQSLIIDFHALVSQLVAEAPNDVPRGKLAVAIASGYFMAFDAHAHFDLAKKIYAQQKDADESLIGIGVQVSLQDGWPVVMKPIPNGPAEKAGIKSGDLILQADSHSLQTQSLNKVLSFLRGKENTIVHLEISRGGQILKIDLVRTRVAILNVEVAEPADIKKTSGMGVKLGYIKLRSFMDDAACEKISKSIRKMQSESQPVAGFVFDLRDDSGGLLDQARCIGGLFLGKRDIVYLLNLTSKKVVQVLQGPDPAVTNKPVVVLINAYSASASEIVSAALQGWNRAWIVGDRSYGKASVQTGVPLAVDENIIFFHTTDRFYMPMLDPQTGQLAMRTNQRVGVIPDFLVPIKPDATAEETFAYHEGDELPYALAEDTAWDALRPNEAAKIDACVKSQGRADAVYAQDKTKDYQLLKAEEVLACELGQ